MRHSKTLTLFILVVASIGCAPKGVATTYGKRGGTSGGPSVNGTAVLAGMFEEAGHRVITWRRLSPKLEQCNTIVWVPDDFQPPTLEQRAFVEQWLFEESGRTLIYVGRDYDAESDYWGELQAAAPAEQLLEVTRRMATAQARHDSQRARMPKAEAADWFTVFRDEPHRIAKKLEGPWSTGIVGSKTDIQMNARLEALSDSEIKAWQLRADNQWHDAAEFTRLLTSDDEAIVTQVTIDDWSDSKIIVVGNGSFLLNLPLINHEHRKLAGKLISECDPGRVAFLESGYGGPMVFDKEPGTDMPTGFAAFTVWPIGFILIHFAVFGILLCIAMFPIFGRARGVATEVNSESALGTAVSVVRADFGKHITALGELLETTEDRQYARDRITYYHEHVKRDSGTSHRNK